MATFTVNTSQDGVNPNDGVLTLREAIQAAALLPGRDTIALSTDVNLFVSLPTVITGNDIDFVGNNRTINGNQNRIFAVDGADVSFQNLTLANGVARGGNGFNGGGGGLGAGGALFIDDGSVFMNNITFQNNQAIGGNAIGFAGSGGNGGNDSGNGFNGGNGGRGGNSSFLVGNSPGGGGGSGGTASVIEGDIARGASSGRSGENGVFGGGGGGAGGGGGGAGGAGAFRKGADGAGASFGGAGGFGAGGGGGGGSGGGGANVLGGTVGTTRDPGNGGLGGSFGGNGGPGIRGTDGRVTFDGDSPGVGGRGGQGGGGAGLGGAIFLSNGRLTIFNSRFVGNRAIGGTGFQNGQGAGGAIFDNSPFSPLISGLTFDSNVALNGSPNIQSENTNEISVPVAEIALPGTIAENPTRTINGLIRLNRGALVDLTLNYTVGGTATAGQDFAPLSGSAVIPAGIASVRIPIQILDDQLFDPNERLTITLTPGLGYNVSTTTPSATMIITDNEIGGPIDPTGQWLGEGGQRNFVVRQGLQRTAIGFQGIGRGSQPAQAVINEVDTIQFEGADLVAENLLLTQVGTDLVLSFEGVRNTQAVLKNFALENLENLTRATGAAVDLGNILFDRQTNFQDSFDVFDANDVRNAVLRRNTVTFLNELDNTVSGFADSNDVINGQDGNDRLVGLSGNDILRGGNGNDMLFAGTGADILVGNAGNDTLNLGIDTATDTVIYRSGDGRDVVQQFKRGTGGDRLQFEGIGAIDVVSNGSSTFFRLSDGISRNAGFGSGQTLLELRNVSGLSASNIGRNLASGNTAQMRFA